MDDKKLGVDESTMKHEEAPTRTQESRSKPCAHCGYTVEDSIKGGDIMDEKSLPSQENKKVERVPQDRKPKREDVSSKFNVWCWLAVTSLVCGCITFIKGIHRMVKYENSDYSWGDHVNAWVGGDAYNYIINGTHATAFFVLTAMFVLAAIGLVIIHYLAKNNLKGKHM